MRENTGKVVLVGAGPGDTGLLTLKGEKYIKQADCLVYDRLSSPVFLSMAKAGCELIYVGKENHNHVMKQDAINELLYEKSKYHELVVRLKGGDPYVFGRGGEEALYLVDRNVEVEVVPGVSSSVAALAAAGIPITHRGIAKGFQVITAHSRKDEEADIDYSLLTDETITCVFLMGLAHVKSIAAGLMKAGRRADTPAAVISNGTLAAQRKCIGTLADIGEKIEEAKLTSPAIIVVGDVVSLNDRLDFFEKRPLFGRKITVPYIKTNELIAKLQQLGADVTPVKTGIINPIIIPEFADKVRSADWIVFTSKNGVRSFFYNLELAGADIRLIDAYVNEQAYESIPESIGNMVSEAVFTSASNVERFFHMLPENAYVETAYSIGEKTTAALEQHNVREIVQADDSSYEALVDKISYKDAFKD